MEAGSSFAASIELTIGTLKPFRIAVEYAPPEPTASARTGVVCKTDLLIASLTIDPQVGSFLVVRYPVSSLFAVRFGAFLDGQPSSTDPNTPLDATTGTHDHIETIEQRTTGARPVLNTGPTNQQSGKGKTPELLPTSAGGNHRQPAGEGTKRMCRIKPRRIMTDDQKAAAISPAEATPQSLAELWSGEAPD